MRRDNLVLQIFAVVQLFLFLVWPTAVIAAQLTFQSTLYSPDMVLDLVITSGIGILVGFSALLNHMKREYTEKGEIDRLWLFVASKMACSMVAALTMYFAADWLDLDRSGTVVSIIVASFLGSVFLERLATWFMDKFFPSQAAP